MSDDCVYLLDENTGTIIKKYSVILSTILIYKNNVYGLGDYLYSINKDGCSKIMPIPFFFIDCLANSNIYLFCDKEIRNLTNFSSTIIPSPPIMAEVKAGCIYILDKNGVTMYSEENLNELHRFSSENISTFCVSPYGLRIFIGEKDKIKVYDTRTFLYVTTITLKGEPKLMKFHPSGDKFYCSTNSHSYVIDKLTYKVKKKLPINAKDIIFSYTTSFGIFVCEDKISFFDTEKDKIIKEWRVNAFDVKVTDDRTYVLEEDGIIIINNSEFEPIKKIKVTGKKFLIK